MSDVFGGDLIDRDVELDVASGSLVGVHAGQVRSGGTGVIAGAVTESAAVKLGEASEDVEIVAVLGEGREGTGELQVE